MFAYKCVGLQEDLLGKHAFVQYKLTNRSQIKSEDGRKKLAAQEGSNKIKEIPNQQKREGKHFGLFQKYHG